MTNKLWSKLNDEQAEKLSGGTVVRSGGSLFNGVPFTELVNPRQGGPELPNFQGYWQSANAIPHAFGAPQISTFSSYEV